MLWRGYVVLCLRNCEIVKLLWRLKKLRGVVSGGNELILRFHWEPLLSQYSCKWKVFKFVVLIKYPWKGMQSWCPNKKALNSKLVSSERRVALLVVTGRTLCFPRRGKEGEGRREGYCQPLSPPQPTLQDQQQARPGNRFNFLDFPLALAAAAVCHTLHLETLKPLPPELPIGKKSLNFLRGFHTVCFSSRCVCQWIALFQEKLLCKSLHSWKIVKQVNWPSFATTLNELLIKIPNNVFWHFAWPRYFDTEWHAAYLQLNADNAFLRFQKEFLEWQNFGQYCCSSEENLSCDIRIFLRPQLTLFNIKLKAVS